jgi:hypothetical protein
MLLVLLLILKPSRPPAITITPDSAPRAEAKVQEFQEAMSAGEPKPLEMNESELNAWLGSNLSLQRSNAPSEKPADNESSGLARTEATAHPAPISDPTIAEVQSSVRDVKIALVNDSLRAYVLFDFHGKELSLELDGRLSARDGYLRIEPTSGHLGSLPLLGATLESAAQKIFDDPKNKEKFRLPPSIADVRIVNGNLAVIPR